VRIETVITGTLEHGADVIRFENTGTSLDACGSSGEVRDVADGLDIGGARWFRDEPACRQAIARHQPLAVDLRGCVAPAPPPPDDAGGRRRFEAIVLHTGTLVEKRGGACWPLAVSSDPTTTGRGMFIETLDAYSDFDTPYDYADGRLTVHGGHDVVARTPPPDYQRFGFGTFVCRCEPDPPLVFRADGVIGTEAYFFTRAGCEASIARDRERASWEAR
jgi:hypothetical protein